MTGTDAVASGGSRSTCATSSRAHSRSTSSRVPASSTPPTASRGVRSNSDGTTASQLDIASRTGPLGKHRVEGRPDGVELGRFERTC